MCFYSDNDHEIGMEPERTWGWGNRKRKNSSSSSGWIHRNKQKLDSVNDNKCCDITSRGESGEKKTPGTIELIMASRRRKPEPERADREVSPPPPPLLVRGGDTHLPLLPGHGEGGGSEC